MNNIFRIVFNTTTGRWVVASEMAKGRKKTGRTVGGGALLGAVMLAGVSGSASAGEVAYFNDFNDGMCTTFTDSYTGTYGVANAACALSLGTAAPSSAMASGANLISNGNGLFARGGLEVFGNNVVAGQPAAYIHGGLSLFGGPGMTGGTNKLMGLANGTADTDAVNVSQLEFALDGMGGGASINPFTGLVTGPTYVLTNADGTTSTVAGVEGALYHLDDRVYNNTTQITNLSTQLSSGTVGMVQQAGAGQKLTVGKDTDGSEVDFANAAGEARTLTGVAAGTVSATSTDAINGSQLHGVSQSVKTALGGSSVLNADGTISVPSYTVTNADGTTSTVAGVEGALGNLDGRVYNNTTQITNLSTQLSSGTVGMVQQACAGQKLTVGKDADGSEVDFANNAGRARRLTRVAAGTASEDAVNVSQLTSVVNGMGGGASIDPVTGLVTGPTYLVTNSDGSQSQVHTVGDAVTNLDGRVYNNTTQITNLSSQLSSGTVGMVQQAGAGQKLTVGKDTDGSEVSFANAAGEARRLSGVAAGSVSATSTDAINGSQLYGVSQSVATALGGGSAVNADGTVAAPTYAVTNADGTTSKVTGVEGAITNLDGRVYDNTARLDNVESNVSNLTHQINSGAVGLVQQAAPGEQLTVGKAADGTSVNFAGTAGDRVLTGVAAGKADNDAVNMGQLKASGMIDEKGQAKAMVAYDDADKGGVTLGGAGAAKPVAMHNVAAGVSDLDAVNVAQLNARLQAQGDTILAQVNNYADDRFQSAMGAVDDLRSDVDDRFQVQDARIDRLSAMSSAMANMTSSMGGVGRTNRIGVGAGATNGRLAMAVGYQRAFMNDGATLTAGASFTDEDTTIGVGAGFGW
jgi:hypothetical protein